VNYKILFTPEFEKEIKRLSKKYFTVKNDFVDLLQTLEEDPAFGVPLGNK
jgi:mRNA-degrading endonuclease RelE of RelBE toxin-antitoxin system